MTFNDYLNVLKFHTSGFSLTSNVWSLEQPNLSEKMNMEYDKVINYTPTVSQSPIQQNSKIPWMIIGVVGIGLFFLLQKQKTMTR